MSKTSKKARTNQFPITNKEAIKLFKKSVTIPTNGANSYLETFLIIIHRTMDTMQSFSLQDILNGAQMYDIPPHEVKSLFEKWVDEMVRLNKVEIIKGCYDYDIVRCL
jgi:hypothetical protein